MPDLPCSSADQTPSAVFPIGATAPPPVITTRVVFTDRPCRDAPLSRLLFDVADGVSDRGDLLRVFIGDLEAELLLEPPHQLHPDGRESPLPAAARPRRSRRYMYRPPLTWMLCPVM